MLERKPKLLMVTEAMGGGVLTYLSELTSALISDFCITVAYGRRPQTPQNLNLYFSSEVNLVRIPHFQRSIDPINDIKATSELHKIVEQINPDIVHLHSSKAGIIGRVLLWRSHRVVCYTPHGYSFLMEDSSKAKRLEYREMEKIAAKSGAMTVSCSRGEYDETMNLTSNSRFISNGINTQQLDAMINAFADHNAGYESLKKVFTLGRICEQKNPRLFNAIALELPDYEFIWIGDGEMRSVLTAPNIRITGWLTREEAINIAGDSDIFVLTSLWEGLPISLLEAMYMQKLCVVSDVIGNHDVITNRVNGFVCNDVSDFVKAIRCTNVSQIQDLTNRAKYDVATTYTTTRMAEEYKTLYLQLLNHSKLSNTIIGAGEEK